MAHSLNMPYTDLGPGPHKNTWGGSNPYTISGGRCTRTNS